MRRDRLQGLAAFLVLQLALLRVRWMPRLILIAAPLAAGTAVLLSASREGEGYQVLAESLSAVTVVLLVLGALQGALAMTADASDGALRGVLLRPISRSAVVVGHALIGSALMVSGYLLGLIAAWILASTVVGLGPAVHHSYVILDKEVLLGYAGRLMLLPLPGLLAGVLVGLTVSALLTDVAASVVLALALVPGPVLLAQVAPDMPAWLFTERALHPLRVLGELAAGEELQRALVDRGSYIALEILQPLAACLLALAVGLFGFNRREITG